ncbi:hypothetical protein DYB28_014546 [Aphanomyces astaci]|uniref:Neutral ceramidase n=1 Tax=Aphanomyces astaci TaxID=112090 RepID=A0A9X8HH84_APHAT|nr:hypothetical protein DYB28_014546 [Aphanomyces astaci]
MIRTLSFVCLVIAATFARARYLIGIGKADITGPTAEVVFAGFADSNEKGSGLLNRQFARAFVVQDDSTNSRILLVNCDAFAVFQLVHTEVLTRLQTKYGSMYTEQNVLLHATHTHATPGGSSAYFLYDVSILGYIDESFRAIVDGILAAIDAAHRSLAPGTIRFNQGHLPDGGRNRSPLAYDANPAAERAQYTDDRDHTMQVLKFKDAKTGRLRGVWATYPVHPTSLTVKNTLVSGDNKGYAMFLAESHYKNKVVVGLGMSNAGDVSPNRVDNGNGTFRGEGRTPIESAEIIGTRQANKLLELLASPSVKLVGSVVGKLSYVDFSNVTLTDVEPSVDAPYAHRTCPAVLGQNFGAGSEDGRGLDQFMEGNLKANPFFQLVSFAIRPTPKWVKTCQHTNKVPLLATGLMSPVPWSPEVLPVQVVKIGQIALASVPFEVTTMAGRRIRQSIMSALGGSVSQVAIAAVSNGYAQYLTTKEEYLVQHYEGASTLFGPNQLVAVQQELARVAKSVANPSIPLASGPRPRSFDRSKLLTLQTGVVLDTHPIGWPFGSIRSNVRQATYHISNTSVKASFVGAHPKNNFQHVASFCDVEKLDPATTGFATYLTDAHWDVRFRWARVGISESTSECEWVLRSARPGVYRFRHRGFAKSWFGVLVPYEGVSASFVVVV